MTDVELYLIENCSIVSDALNKLIEARRSYEVKVRLLQKEVELVRDIDAAFYYCPYVPLTSSGVVIDPGTFEPIISFMTRYGHLNVNDTTKSD